MKNKNNVYVVYAHIGDNKIMYNRETEMFCVEGSDKMYEFAADCIGSL